MKADTVLDHVELQLSSPRSSRCELLIAAEGETEKLACGFLQTFLSHMRVAQELHAAGAQLALRLEGPQVFNGSRRPWFTKGTLERFVQYVSAPEVLERVKSIEDELAQLEQVRSIQCGSLLQVSDTFANPLVLRAGIIPADSHVGLCQYSAASHEEDDSKRELLKAMDARLSALQQEQDLAFNRAAATGFDADSIEDLLAFSEFFGADRLRVACNWFRELCAKHRRASITPVHQEVTSQANFVLSSKNPEMENGLMCRASGLSASGDSNGMGVQGFVVSKHCRSPTAPMSDEVEVASPVRPSQLQGNMSKAAPQRSSPRRRSGSPLKKVQVGRFGSRRPGSVVIRSINYFSSHDRTSKERHNTVETSSSDSEDDIKSYNLDERAPVFTSSPAAARQLSVQAAINLFESRQCKEIDESQEKQKCTNQESWRGSLDGANASISGICASRQQGGMGRCIASSLWLQEGITPRQSLGYGCISDNFTSRTEDATRPPGMYPYPSNCNRTCGLSAELESDELLHYQGGLQQFLIERKKSSPPSEAHKLRQCSSTSEDFVASELDSVGSSPLTRGVQFQLEHIDSETSNAKSTLTSISQGDASVDSIFYHPAPSSPAITISSAAHDLQNSSGGHKCNKVIRDDSLLVENGAGLLNYSCEEDNVPSKYGDNSVCTNLGIQALASMVDSPSINAEILGTNEGRFYEQYRKRRDAKMMEEQQSKRAEREAKLRLMEETLELRKAEMDARTAMLNKDSHHARAAKLLALKASLGDMPRVPEDEVTGQSKTLVVTKDLTRSDSSPPSPPLTPRVVKEQVVTPKLHRAKKSVTAAQKNSNTPRSSARATSVSPKTTPKGMVGKPSSHRSAVSPNISENPLACSVPCFSDLKKDNPKPSPGKSSGSARVQSKNNAGGVNPAVTNRASSLLEPNGSVSCQNSLSTKATRADRKNHAWQTRQSYAAAELKGPATASEDEVSGAPNAQKDTKIETPLFSKIRRSAVAPIQEVRPFLRKGSGIGPGAGPGVMKLKADAIKSSDEDAPGTPLKNSDEETPMTTTNITDTSHGENMSIEETDANAHPCLSSQTSGEKEDIETSIILNFDATQQPDGGVFPLCGEAKPHNPCTDDDLFENERVCHTISFPIDFVMHERPAVALGSNHASTSKEPRAEVIRREGDASATLSQLLSESASQILKSESSVNGSASFRATLSADQQSAPKFSPMKAASLASSSLKRLGATIPDHFSPATAARLGDSPLGSPASWNSSHVQYASETEAARSQKKPSSSQKPVVMVVPPKEPAKGLRRLLKFGRKSRATPEILITDGVSASTPSEGDEDFEDVKERSMHSAQDLLRKVKLQERLLKDFGMAGLSGDHANIQDKGSYQSLQSSIPIPPSNFKLNYDRVPGGSKPKASRSFFSLSTFRSRGSGGKTR